MTFLDIYTMKIFWMHKRINFYNTKSLKKISQKRNFVKNFMTFLDIYTMKIFWMHKRKPITINPMTRLQKFSL